MDVGIVGLGFVGGTLAQVLKKAHKILSYDPYKEGCKDPKVLKSSEIIFICVPTPMKPSGQIDYSFVHDSLLLLEEIFEGIDKEKRPLVVIRSTVVPGTTDSLESKYSFNFASNPEFLREKFAIEDMLNTKRIVIGAKNEGHARKIFHVYNPLFPNANYINVDVKTAEMVKYSSNIFLAGQVTLANEIFKICKSLGINYDEIKNAMLLDKRIGTHIGVPGPDGDFGFGGKCFPKDLNALIYLAREKGYRPDFLEEIWRSNKRFRNEEDWNGIPGAVSENKKFN